MPDGSALRLIKVRNVIRKLVFKVDVSQLRCPESQVCHRFQNFAFYCDFISPALLEKHKKIIDQMLLLPFLSFFFFVKAGTQITFWESLD